MNKEYQTRRDIKEFDENPFIASLITSTKTRNSTVAFAGNAASIVDHDTGEHLGDSAVIGIQRRVERAEFIKLYEGGIAAAFDLSKSGQGVLSVLLHLYRESKHSPETVYFNFNAAKKDFGYERGNTTFTKGINELMLKSFIAPVAGKINLYWINPAFFFKGDRLRIINEFVLKSKKDVQGELEKRGQQRLADI